jgi:hypothetical protein
MVAEGLIEAWEPETTGGVGSGISLLPVYSYVFFQTFQPGVIA